MSKQEFHDRLFMWGFTALFALICFCSCGQSDSASSSVTLRGRGQMPPILVWEPTLLDYGTVEVGQIADLVSRMTNTGGTAASGSIALDSACEVAFTILDGGGVFVLAPGEHLDVTVRFSPVDGSLVECAMRASY